MKENVMYERRLFGRLVHLVWHNDNRRRGSRDADGRFRDGPKGLPTQGSFTVYLVNEREDVDGQVRLEWAVPAWHSLLRAQVRVGDEEDLGLAFGLAGVSVHVSASLKALRGLRARDEKVWGIYAAAGDGDVHVVWNVGDDPWGDDRRGGSFFVFDRLLGRTKHESRVLEEADVVVPMPEGGYEAHAKLTEWTVRRPRWPFPSRGTTVHIDIPKGIPHPGKGENSWDCGDDATFGLSTPARSIEDGVGALVASVLRSRKRHGGRGWVPSKKGEAA